MARALTDRDLSDQLLARGLETALMLLDDRVSPPSADDHHRARSDASYQARSGAALAAVALALGIAATTVVVASAERAKEAAVPPNLSDRQLRVYMSPPGFRATPRSRQWPSASAWTPASGGSPAHSIGRP